MENKTIYEVKYFDKDGNLSLYCGLGKGAKEMYEAEIERCIRLGYKYTATIKKEKI